jgi:aconitate hydratase
VAAAIDSGQPVRLTIHRADGGRQTTHVRLRVETPDEVAMLRHGGLLPWVFRSLLPSASNKIETAENVPS